MAVCGELTDADIISSVTSVLDENVAAEDDDEPDCVKPDPNLKEPLNKNFQHNISLTVVAIYIQEVILHTISTSQLRNQDVHKYGTRSSTDFVVPPHHLTLYSKKLTYAGAKFFNLLPDDMKNHNPQQLKRHLKDWLLKRPFYSIEEYLRWKDFPDYT
ncbi:hypothetical protein J6590_072608 [Homalodisca vitripennis]|nr:hypothetical protein J6590_072608 [Homalodisca vitripennis]